MDLLTYCGFQWVTYRENKFTICTTLCKNGVLVTKPEFTCSKLLVKTLEQCVKPLEK